MLSKQQRMATYFVLKTLAISFGATTFLSAPARADVSGEKSVYLVSKSGEETKVATLNFSKNATGSSYKLEYDYSKFEEHFLSMRPFKCLQTSAQMLCHLAYPYKSRHAISKDDLQDLEYDFLYIHKAPGEYGINFWNGIYYKISQKPDGTFEGILMETDMDVLASPPEDYTRPITHGALNENEDGKHFYPKMLIK